MTALLAQLRQLVARFRCAERGVAVVEFALILPVMLAVYIGTVEASTLIIVDRKVQSVAGSVGDLVARADGVLSASSLTDYFRAAGGIMEPYSAASVVQLVTGVEVLADGTTDVVWQANYQNGVYHRVEEASLPATYDLPAEMAEVALGKMVIAAEVTYAYTPLFGIVIDQSVDLHRSNFFLPRYGEDIALN